MQKFEYHVVRYHNAPPTSLELSSFGAEGWRVLSLLYTGDDNDYFVVTFERPFTS